MKSVLAFLLCATALSLTAAQTFHWKLEGADLVLTVPHDHYIYANDSFRITADARPVESPSPVEIEDEFFGKTRIFPAGTWTWRYRNAPAQVKVDFQGCRKGSPGEGALCFLPETVTLGEESVTAAKPETGAVDLTFLDRFQLERQAQGMMNVAHFKEFLAPTGTTPASAGMFADTGIFLVLLLTLLGGIGLNLTPCVLPMIPVNLAIIGADGSDRKTGFRRGFAYGAGMAAAYGGLGVIVILTGARFGELNSSSVFNFVIAGIFLLLALAMFGIFNLDLSGKLRLSPKKLSGSKTVIALIMGVIAALLAGACVAPVVIGVLLFAAELYNAGNFFALLLPFLLGVGMALPWPFAGAGFAVLPKPGRFMEIVKYVFGVIIVLAALYYAYTGYTLLPGNFSPETEIARLENTLARTGKPVLIDFWATWCKNCRDMEKNVFPDPAIQEELKHYEMVKFQAEKLDAPQVRLLLDRYGIKGLPAFVILKKE